MRSPRAIRHYGWCPDLPDFRDKLYGEHFLVPSASTLPAVVDLRKADVPIFDQGQLGSCTANAIGGDIRFCVKKQGAADFDPARLMLYYEERVLEGDPSQDNGAEIRGGMYIMHHYGVCAEAAWPYDINKFAVKPSPACYQQARQHLVEGYYRLDNWINGLRSCLSLGFPFVFGFTVYDSFESQEVADTGVVPMPSPDEQVLGGHATMAVGYDSPNNVFIVRNSWGTDWGMKGYFTIPMAYLSDPNLSADFWTVRLMEIPPTVKTEVV